MQTVKQHWKDPLSAEERQQTNKETLKHWRKHHPNDIGQTMYMETTYMGVWCGVYRVGDEYAWSGRYVYVGVV